MPTTDQCQQQTEAGWRNSYDRLARAIASGEFEASALHAAHACRALETYVQSTDDGTERRRRIDEARVALEALRREVLASREFMSIKLKANQSSSAYAGETTAATPLWTSSL